MSSRYLATVAAAPLVGISFVLPAAAHASVQQGAAVTGMTAGRLGPTAAALVGLTGVIGGLFALTRSGGRVEPNTRMIAVVVALVAGLTSVILGGLFTATADGGPGTGNGIVGAVVAVVLGLISTVLGGRALARSRRRAD
ncbi:DUF6223 family protein [Nocardia carnea]|uniref:DUF6223 family protein n=1 Tax=Nocardia carnea TaxID=37328 RepID=UPI002453A84D|nr:DUF6223 family protein [Nocardia carnea]